MHDLSLSPLYGSLLGHYLKKVEHKAGFSRSEKEFIHKTSEISASTERISQQEIETLVKKIMAITGDMSFGLELGAQVHPSDYGAVGYALMNCGSLREVMHYAARHKHALNKGFDVSLQHIGTRYHYRLENLSPSPYLTPVIELDFASLIQLGRFFVGKDKAPKVKLQEVRFQHKPLARLEKYQETFHCPVKFNQVANEIIITKAVLDIPVRSANPRLLKLMQATVLRHKQWEKAQLSLEQNIIHYLQAHMDANLDTIIPPITQAAQDFNMSVSKLKKQLGQHGTNYTLLCDESRKARALKLLNDPNQSLSNIARHIGLSSASAFTRAFRRWTSMTPLEYRKTQRSPPQ